MKTIIITGATGGIGYECALELARLAPDEQLIIACRNPQSGNEVMHKIRQATGHTHLLTMPLDLNSLW